MRHCAALGVAPEIGRRSTVYNRGDVSKLSPAIELYAFRAQSDPDRLLAALEAIIIKRVLENKLLRRRSPRAGSQPFGSNRLSRRRRSPHSLSLSEG